jgi:hypothetical protein
MMLVSAWREAGDIFTDKEKAALHWAEAVTLISETHAPGIGGLGQFLLSCLPRHTGEVARRARGGKPQSRYLQISDLKLPEIACVAFPLRPLRGHLPRKTGEA